MYSCSVESVAIAWLHQLTRISQRSYLMSLSIAQFVQLADSAQLIQMNPIDSFNSLDTC